MSINSEIFRHLPALQVAIPMLAAPLCAFIRHSVAARTWTLFIFVLCVFSAFALAHPFFSGEGAQAYRYAFGGWEAPRGIGFHISAASMLLLIILSCAGCAVSLLVFSDARLSERAPVYSCLLLLCYAGLCGMTLTHDIFNFYVFLEISSLSAYALIALGKDRRALVSSYEYLILGSAGACFLLVGVALLYAMTGVLDMPSIAALLPHGEQDALIGASLAFITIGMLMKIATPPLHLWMVNAYTNASSATVAFLAATATKVAIFMTIKILYVMYGDNIAFERFHMDALIGWVGSICLLVGAYMAAMQHNIKRIFAYSSVAWIGYILIALSYHDERALAITMMIILHHAVVKCAILFCIHYLETHTNGSRLADMRDMYRRAPLAAGILTLLSLSLAGIPGLSGFTVKWELMTYLAGKDAWLHLVVLAIGSLLAFTYTWRIVETFRFETSQSAFHQTSRPKSVSLLLAGIGLALSLWFGLLSDTLARVGTFAAATFF